MEDIDAIAVLQDPVRRRLYEYVAAQDHEVSRNQAAEGTGVQRTLAAFHLDKLAAAGLLETESRRLTGRSGPGAGRPAKLYRRAAAEHEFSLPARDYRTAADLLAEVAEAARLDAELQEAARRQGRALRGDDRPEGELEGGLEAVAGLLASRGYEPRLEEDEGGAVIRMRNCPFHALSQRFPPLVCGMNLALLEGLLEGAEGVRVRMDARPGLCCTVVEESKNNED
ncbi:helix-turn-helix transcriptional regulator [Actinomadura rudentiformis]|uniref:Helix-turn-helix domain-containing protein n=1 Tax=Actinomadura rudentiformis TaxID=359158 RepID=A0A6H9Z3D8_9ACTN|nr:helix-turn-helix domain-containing protein [Actinomadura rudentiformis]KAB2348957.1 helix-turn-helix domain-containing protein [Actinomadura rudentiformis]